MDVINESFEQKYPHLKEFHSFLGDLNKESARGAVLISFAYIDDLLSQILRSFFLEIVDSKLLFEGVNAPFSSLYTKSTTAYSLGLITKREFDEINVLRKIRNEFAHLTKVSFEAKKISELCNKLSYSAPDYREVVVDARGKFTTSAVAIILNLTNRPAHVVKERCKSREWPY